MYEVDPDADTLLIVPVASCQTGDFHFKVSSKHLSLASKPLRDQLRLASRAAAKQADNGPVHLRLAGDDYNPAVITILMDVIHGRGSRVPRSADIKTLEQMAAFVSQYKCHEAVEPYAARWLVKSTLASDVQASVAETVEGNTQLARCIFITYVFRHEELFTVATHAAILRMDPDSLVKYIPDDCKLPHKLIRKTPIPLLLLRDMSASTTPKR